MNYSHYFNFPGISWKKLEDIAGETLMSVDSHKLSSS